MRIALFCVILAAGLTTACLGTELAAAQTDTAAHDGVVNVRDHGAKGDNVTDDTKAIRSAVEATAKPPYPELFFPAGTYVISDTIKLDGQNVRGKSATIRQIDPGKDVLYFAFSWRTIIEGLTFEGGAKQLNLGNNFVDQGLLTIRDCRFQNSKSFAVYLERRSYATHFVITNCIFSTCDQALYTIADWTTFSDSWITSSQKFGGKAVIEARGTKMVCENIVGVPLVNGLDQRWIDNYGNLTCRNFRFGGEGGGFTPVVNWTKGTNIVLDDCCAWADGNLLRNCAVYCEEVPTLLMMKGCFLGVPPVRLKRGLDVASAFKNMPEGTAMWDVAGNNGPFMDDAETKRILQAVAKRDKSLPPIEGAFDDQQTREALARIIESVRKLAPASQATPLESFPPQQQFGFAKHTQKTSPADYVEFAYDPQTWDVRERMDNQLYRNGAFIACAPVGDDVVVMRRAPGLHPHIAIRHVSIDLDKTPVFSWKLKDPGIKMPSGHAVKIIDEDTMKMRLLLEYYYPDHFFDYNAVDLREAFGLTGGVHKFTVRFYALDNDCTVDSRVNRAGDYQVIDFIRAERP